MKQFYIYPLILLFSCTSEDSKSVSTKTFPPISLLNKIEYQNPEKDFEIGNGFLLKYREDTFVVTAKHILLLAKTDSMNFLTLKNCLKKWSLMPLGKENEYVVAGDLLNENNTERLDSKDRFINDFLIFNIKENTSNVKPLEFRDKPLVKGEKLYVVGWTRHMTEGQQRVYEFKYHKTKGNHHLLKNLIVPDKFGGLSGSPLLDEDGKLVGIVSNGTFDILSLKKLFSPCGTDSLKVFLDNYMIKRKYRFSI